MCCSLRAKKMESPKFNYVPEANNISSNNGESEREWLKERAKHKQIHRVVWTIALCCRRGQNGIEERVLVPLTQQTTTVDK